MLEEEACILVGAPSWGPSPPEVPSPSCLCLLIASHSLQPPTKFLESSPKSQVLASALWQSKERGQRKSVLYFPSLPL